MPSQTAMSPTSGNAMFITASFAVVNAPSVIASSRPVNPPTSTAVSTRASQMRLSIGDVLQKGRSMTSDE